MTDEQPTTGSIVFRNQELTTSPRVSVSDVMQGAVLAAKYRECAFGVDVISRQDEIVVGWKNGMPSVNTPTAQALSNSVAIYQQPDNGYDDDQSALYMRLQAIGQMLQWGFQLAVGSKTQYHDPHVLHAHPAIDADLYQIEKEGHLLRSEVENTAHDGRAALIDDWLSDVNRSFVGYRLEFMALGMLVESFCGYEHINQIEQELARVHAVWEMETQNERPI